LFLLFLNSLRVVFPAACGEFVIPAEAGMTEFKVFDTPLLAAG